MSEFDQPLSSHMVAPVHTLLASDGLAQAARALEVRGVSALPVVDGSKRLTGVLERADLLRVGRLRTRASEGEPRWSWPDLRVAECMQTAVPVAPPHQPLQDCARRMLDRRLHRVYVLADEQLVGVISTRELMLAVARAAVDTPIAQLAAGAAQCVDASEPVSVASARLSTGSGRPLVVLDGGAPVGVFAQPELRACLEAEADQQTRLYMDPRVIALPADQATDRAAREAAAARARYIIALDAQLGYRVITGLCFAARVCGSAPPDPGTRTTSLPAAGMPLGSSGFDATPATPAGDPLHPELPFPAAPRMAPARPAPSAPTEPAPGDAGAHEARSQGRGARTRE